VKLIVGLGNPGPQYTGTRHNVGFEVVDELGRRHGISLGREKFHAWYGLGHVVGEQVLLLKPTTYMNRSGRAVVAAGRFYKLELDDLLVIADDLALPTGRLRLRVQGSAGSHKGLQDIIERAGSEAWCRLRIGIGAAPGSGTSHVLGRFGAEEEELMQQAVARAADAVECWVEQGPERAMNRFNVGAPET